MYTSAVRCVLSLYLRCVRVAFCARAVGVFGQAHIDAITVTLLVCRQAGYRHATTRTVPRDTASAQHFPSFSAPIHVPQQCSAAAMRPKQVGAVEGPANYAAADHPSCPSAEPPSRVRGQRRREGSAVDDGLVCGGDPGGVGGVELVGTVICEGESATALKRERVSDPGRRS